MNFSKLRERVTILEPTNSKKNLLNETIVTHKPFKTVWACVVPMSGREYAEAQKIRAETTYKVYMRFIPGITSEMQIDYNGRILKIESILDLNGRHKELQLVASETDKYGKEEC